MWLECFYVHKLMYTSSFLKLVVVNFYEDRIMDRKYTCFYKCTMYVVTLYNVVYSTWSPGYDNLLLRTVIL